MGRDPSNTHLIGRFRSAPLFPNWVNTLCYSVITCSSMPARFLFHKEREHHDSISEELVQLLPRFACFVVSPESLKVGPHGGGRRENGLVPLRGRNRLSGLRGLRD